jgi:hypothetical protein
MFYAYAFLKAPAMPALQNINLLVPTLFAIHLILPLESGSQIIPHPHQAGIFTDAL